MIKILVGLHPGYTNNPAVERALGIARQTDVEIVLYSAVYDEHFAGLRLNDGFVMKRTREAMVAAEAKKLDDIKDRIAGVARQVEVNSEWHFPAAHGIIAAAEAINADLIIVSSTQRSIVNRWLLTNTDWEVLRHATIPVLLAHHREFRPYKTVMAAVDPTHSHDKPAEIDHKIVEQARWMANYFDGHAHLAHAYPSARTLVDSDYVPAADTTELWRKDHSAAVHALAAKHNIDDANIHLIDEHATRAIPHLADKLSADLVVIGVVSRSFLKGLMVSRTTERVLDHLECDVMTVRMHSTVD